MGISLPKYIRPRRGSYHYQRRYPTRLKHLIQQSLFTYPLQLQVASASVIEIQKATIKAEEAYQRQLLLISNSDPDALSATDLEKAAADFLRKRGLVAGQYVKVAKDADISVKEEEQQRQLQADGHDYADWAVPEFEDVVHKDKTGQPLTLQDKIVAEARMKLVNKAKVKPNTLGSLWDEYVHYRGIDPESRNGKKAFKYWNRWISLAGDTVISKATLQHINDGMDANVLDREGQVSSQTLLRELGDVTACLRKASRHLLNYGSTVMSQSEIVQTLYQDSLKIHQHLVDIEYDSQSNVVSINRRS
jgi:hypothetical protein